MVLWAPRLPPAVSGSNVRCWCVCWARVSAVPSPSWLGCRGVFFALFPPPPFFLVVPVPGLVVPVPSSPFFRAGLVALFFFFSACFGVPFPGGPLFLAWCCEFWVGGPPVPLWGSCLRCLLGGGVWPPLVVLGGGLAAVGCFRAFSPSPLRVFFLGGGLACSSLCLPWVGARIGLHSVLSSGVLFSVGFCLVAFRPHGSGELCTR